MLTLSYWHVNDLLLCLHLPLKLAVTLFLHHLFISVFIFIYLAWQ